MRANAFNTGIASEYLILSKLYRLDFEAYVSQGNKKSIDIRVVLDDNRAISIDVKAVRGYSSLVVNNVIAKRDHFLVFVIYNNKFENLEVEPEIYIVPSFDVAEITKVFGTEKRVMKGDLADYKDRWDNLLMEHGEDGWLYTDEEEKTIDEYLSVRLLKDEGLSRQEICEELGYTEAELNDLDVRYNQATGN